MTTIEEKKKEIERHYQAVQSQYDNISNLENEVESLEKNFEQTEKEYVTLIRKGENEKADKVYEKYQELKNGIEVKKSRLETIKRYKKETTLENWKEISKLMPGLKQQFRLENEDLIKEYVEARKVLKKAEEKVKGKAKEIEAYIYGLEMVQSEQFNESGVSGYIILGKNNVLDDAYIESRMNDFN